MHSPSEKPMTSTGLERLFEMCPSFTQRLWIHTIASSPILPFHL
jgi:hypothetical protein